MIISLGTNLAYVEGYLILRRLIVGSEERGGSIFPSFLDGVARGGICVADFGGGFW